MIADANLIGSLKQSFIFKGMSDEECMSLLETLSPEIRDFEKEQIIFREGDTITRFGLVLEGAVFGYKVSIDGRESIGQLCRKNHFFAIEFAASQSNECFFCYKCVEDAWVCFFDYRKLVNADLNIELKKKIFVNIIDLLTRRTHKNFERMEILKQKSLRERILLYLEMMSKRRKCTQFTICVTRGEMAEYLSVNRSALSNELRKMKDDGIIDYDRNSFRLIK